MWQPDDIWFEVLDDLTDDPVVTVSVDTPDGRVRFMAEVAIAAATLTLRGLHVQDARPNALGAANLKVLVQVVMERMELDEIIVEGAIRTSGANPGRRPGMLRFRRRVRAQPAASTALY